MTKNTPIIFVCLKLSNGGSERVLSVLANGFADKGYDVTFIILFKSVIDYKLSEKIKLIDLAWENPCSLVGYFDRIKQLRRNLNQRGAVVISFLFRTIFWVTVSTMFLNVIRIYSERNDPRRDPNRFYKRILRDLCYVVADRIVFQTEEQMNYYPRFIREKGVIIGNPVIGGLPRHNPLACKKVIMSVCRLEEQKNLFMAIDAFEEFNKIHNDFEYHIYGRGELENALREYISEKNLKKYVKIKGYVSDVHERMKDSMMLISSSYYEGISNSILEALAIGLPVVSTDCPIGGNRMLIENGVNGILVEVGNKKGLVESMNMIADDYNVRECISNEAIDARNKYSVDVILSKWENIR